MPKSWSEKFNDPRPPEVKPAPIDIAGMKKGEIMLIPTPKIIDAFMRTIRRGVSMDVKTFRAKLARKHKAEVTCPITTGFHLRTVAENAYATHQNGVTLDQVTPFWRVVDANTPTAKKLSFGSAFIAQQRKAEGLKP